MESELVAFYLSIIYLTYTTLLLIYLIFTVAIIATKAI
jgi:hypothetical protein